MPNNLTLFCNSPLLHSPAETMLAFLSCCDFLTRMFDINFLSSVCSSISSDTLPMLPISRTASSRTEEQQKLKYGVQNKHVG